MVFVINTRTKWSYIKIQKRNEFTKQHRNYKWILQQSKDEPNSVIHILSTGGIGDGITTNVVHKETVPVLHNTANTQIRKHHILVAIGGRASIFENEP